MSLVFKGFKDILLVLIVTFPFLGSGDVHSMEIQRVVSSGGIEAWLVEDHSLPIVSIRFSFPGGSVNDPTDKSGLANMSTKLLGEGAGEFNSQKFHRRLEDLSVSLNFEAYKDIILGSMKTLTRNRDEAFDLLKLALLKPRFDDDSIQLIRAQIRSRIARNKNNPNNIAQRTYWSMMFPEHPYRFESSGTFKSIAKISKYDLKSFVRSNLVKTGLIIGVAGDITADELALSLDKTFGGLPRYFEKNEIENISPRTLGKVVVVKNNLPQSSIVFGQNGLARNHPDYYAAYLLNHILGGGGFTSRLYKEIREKRGLVYSVYSYLLPLDYSSLWLGAAATDNKSVRDTIKIIKSEWSRMQDYQITQEQLQSARDNIKGSFSLRFNNTASIAGMLLEIQRKGLGINYIQNRENIYDMITINDINRVAKKWLDPKSLTFVIVGNPSNIISSEVISGK